MILATGESRGEGRSQVLKFFDKTSLLYYDRIVIDEDRSLSAGNQGFSPMLEKALSQNRQVVANLVEELGAAGFATCTDLPNITQGYQSKVLHILAHFLDGFIGIDSVFYNMVNDSHWLPQETSDLIRDEPERFWLFPLDCYSVSPKEAALLHQ